MSVLTSSQLSSMRNSFSSVMPNSATNSRTSFSNKCWVEEDKTAWEPGLTPLATLQRWRIIQPFGTDVARTDYITVTGFGTYQVIDAITPESYQLAVSALCYQVKDASGNPVSPIYFNATVKCFRGGSLQGTTRRVRLELVADGAINTSGEIMPDTLWDIVDADWKLNDVLEIESVDGHTAVPHPQQYRIGVVTRVGELPPLTTARLNGVGGMS